MNDTMILIADDTPANVFVLAAMLRSFGHACRIAVDGAEAVAMAEAAPPALILMDINMPKLNGIEAARRIRDARTDGRVAIVAVTAHPDSRHLPDFRRAEFDDVIVKPVDLGLLRAVVTKHLAAR